jgi:2-polyprenyl-3-methyl-5-hydroxy-6-metoxy-1,4-benzoquinol methylase
MTEIIEEMQTYYARRAPVYEASMRYDDPAHVALHRGVITSLLREMTGKQVLELACGPGFWTQMVAEVAATITATDYNESMLEQTRQKTLDPTKVSLRTANAYDLSSLTDTFDAAFAMDWLAHVPRLRMTAFFDGLHQRLRPGARVVFCDQTPIEHSFTGLYDPEGNHLQDRTLPDGSHYRVIKHFFSESELEQLFAP